MPELRLYNNRVVMTVFDLLGTKDDLTYAVGWGLADSDALCRALMSAAFGADDDSELTGAQLQHSRHGAGRTDIEVNSVRRALVVEAKRGWNLPTEAQLEQYARRRASELSAETAAASSERAAHVLVVSECLRDYPRVAELPPALHGIPISYMPWSKLPALVDTVTGASSTTKKRLLRELHRYQEADDRPDRDHEPLRCAA